MRIERRKKTIIRIIYVAFDGLEFDYEDDCLRYEAFIKGIETFYDDYELFEPKATKWILLRRGKDVLTLLSFLRLDLDLMDMDSDPIMGDGSDLVVPMIFLVNPETGKWGVYTMKTFKKNHDMETKFKLLRDVDLWTKEAESYERYLESLREEQENVTT